MALDVRVICTLACADNENDETGDDDGRTIARRDRD